MMTATTTQMARKMCTAAAEKVETKIAEKAPLAYSRAASIHHWTVGGALIGCIGCVLKSQQSPKGAPACVSLTEIEHPRCILQAISSITAHHSLQSLYLLVS